MDVVIRPAGADEIGRLGEVERDGDRRYAGYDGVPVGFDDVASLSALERARHEGRLWVAVLSVGTDLLVGRGAGGASDDGGIIGFALAGIIDGNAHLAQVSVMEAHQGEGVGRRLIDAVCGWAGDQSMTAVTLCTFSDVEWNRPLYEHLGFAVLPEENWGPQLRAAFESDGELGLDLTRRVVMRLELPVG